MSKNNGKRIKTFKGFDENLKCRGFQYAVGEEYKIENEEDIELCRNGFHAINEDQDPMSVFDYYPPVIDGKKSRYCEVEVGGNTKTDGNKVVGSEIKVGFEIGIPGIIKAHIDWVKSKITNKNNAEAGKPATAGDSGAATSRGSVSVGVNGVGCVRGNGVKIKGGLGAILMIAVENDNNYDIKEWKTIVVDGKKVKEDTWYTLSNGKIVEVKD